MPDAWSRPRSDRMDSPSPSPCPLPTLAPGRAGLLVTAVDPAATPCRPAHRRRLRELWRSAGWPCHDTIEIELLAAGWVERHFDLAGRETLRVTQAGILVLARTLDRHRDAHSLHEALVMRMVRELQHAGRIAWCGLALRAALPAADSTDPAEPTDFAEPRPSAGDGPAVGRPRWVVAMPDIYSIRHTTVEDYTEPEVHEIKVHRSDLLSDLRRPDKGAAYRELGARSWYVLRAGIGGADDVPPAHGVLIAHDTHIEMQRPAPALQRRVPFAVWMALARAVPQPEPEEREQWPLRGPQVDGDRLDHPAGQQGPGLDASRGPAEA